MIIILDPNDSARVEEIKAAEPCEVWYDIGRIVVRTGADIEQPASQRIITAAQFRDRFTEAEMMAITKKAYGGTGDAPMQLLLLKLATSADGVNLDADSVIAGIDYLVTKGVIIAERKAQLLA